MIETALQKVAGNFSVELPELNSLEEYVEFIVPKIRPWGEDLRETEFYVVKGGKPWLEVRDDPNFHEAVLHFFNEGGEYLTSVEGNVQRGKWRLLEGTNKILIELGNKSELYELAFLSNAFFILRKHGNPNPKRKRNYLVMGYEGYIKGLEWRDYVELLFNTYRDKHRTFRTILILVVVIVLIIVLFSVR